MWRERGREGGKKRRGEGVCVKWEGGREREVCVCKREGGRKEGGKRERERERGCVCVPLSRCVLRDGLVLTRLIMSMDHSIRPELTEDVSLLIEA